MRVPSIARARPRQAAGAADLSHIIIPLTSVHVLFSSTRALCSVSGWVLLARCLGLVRRTRQGCLRSSGATQHIDTHMEPNATAVVLGLFQSGLVGPGDILDAGANDGGCTLTLAKHLASRSVLAIDPLRVNVGQIRQQARRQDAWNVQILCGGLGAQDGWGSYDARADRRVGNQIGRIPLWQGNSASGGSSENVSFRLWKVDSLFRERRLAFAHWDVEGAEPDLLAGAIDVIHRDRPLFTVETHSVHMAREHSQVMQLLNEYHYTAMEIMEVCGGWTDCRNWLCVPSERLPELRAKLPPTTLSLLGESPSTRAREAPFDAWLGSLREGYCAPTRDNSGDCTGGDKGSMRLSAEAAWSFRSSAAECARRCLDCERCRYISFSVGFRDCSWYALRPKAVQWLASRLTA